jgi:bifunctional non-homologous end joining protein LigD
VRDFAENVALAFVRLAPTEFTARMSKSRRAGKIYIDWVRNTHEATAVASYSTRARPGAPVALRSPGRSSPRSPSRSARVFAKYRGATRSLTRGPTSRRRAVRSRVPAMQRVARSASS